MTKTAGSPFTPAESVYLDFLRFALAMMVVVAHVSQPTFQSAIPWDLTNLGVWSVGCFFVLSGYTIAAINLKGGGFEAARFASERFTRLMSVALPAMAFTVVMDGASWGIAPEFYKNNWGTDVSVLNVIANLAFFAQSWGNDLSPLSNSPFWSLSYEAGFYSLFCVLMMAAQNWRLAPLFALAAAYFGPQVSLLFLVWLAGVALRAGTRPQVGFKKQIPMILVPAILLLLEMRHPGGALFTVYGVLSKLFAGAHLGMGRISQALIKGMLAFISVHALLLPVVRQISNAPSSSLRRISRTLGEMTFPLYLLHFPLLVFFKSSSLQVFKSSSLRGGYAKDLV